MGDAGLRALRADIAGRGPQAPLLRPRAPLPEARHLQMIWLFGGPEAAWRPVMMMEIASTTPTIAVIETILLLCALKCPQKRNSMTVTSPPRLNGGYIYRLYLSTSYNLNEMGRPISR